MNLFMDPHIFLIFQNSSSSLSKFIGQKTGITNEENDLSKKFRSSLHLWYNLGRFNWLEQRTSSTPPNSPSKSSPNSPVEEEEEEEEEFSSARVWDKALRNGSGASTTKNDENVRSRASRMSRCCSFLNKYVPFSFKVK